MKKKYIVLNNFASYDFVYKNSLVNVFINYLMQDGNKLKIKKFFYIILLKIKEKLNKNPLKVLLKAILNIAPIIRLETLYSKSEKKNLAMPLKMNKLDSILQGIKFLIFTIKKKGKSNIITKLVKEICDAYNNRGFCKQKRVEIHKLAMSYQPVLTKQNIAIYLLQKEKDDEENDAEKNDYEYEYE